MATIRKRNSRYQVQVRRRGHPPQSRTFLNLPHDPKALQRITLEELVTRYRDTISPRKRSAEIEHIVLSAFVRHPICRKRLSEVTGAVFAAYRDERLQRVCLATVKRDFTRLRHMFEVAQHEWGLPIKENPG
jgi:hypothetical protein